MEQTISHGELFTRAREGDQRAWDQLVEQMSPLIWSIARGFRLDHATAKDVAQTVWMRLLESCDRIEDPDRLPGWMATTTRREAMAVIRKLRRALPSDFEYDVEDLGQSIEQTIIDHEDHEEMRRAFASLAGSDQELLRLVVVDPPESYQKVAEITGRPIGSLGPTRSRALARLRRALEDTEVLAG